MRGREIEQQRLAQPGRGQGMAIADAARDLDTSSPRNLVEIQRAIGIEPAEMHRIPRPRRQRFDVRASDLDEIDLALRDESEMEQLGGIGRASGRERVCKYG